MRDLRCGLLDESFGCGGPTLAGELGQSQLSDVLQRTRVQWELFDYNNRARTVSNPKRSSVATSNSAYARIGFLSCDIGYNFLELLRKREERGHCAP